MLNATNKSVVKQVKKINEITIKAIEEGRNIAKNNKTDYKK